MQFLTTNPRTQEHLNESTNANQPEWKTGSVFVTVREEVRKSWVGILRHVLFQVLTQNPKLIDKVISSLAKGSEQWKPPKPSDYIWTERSLESALVLCKEQSDVPFRFCLFLDGLDEHEGDFGEHCRYLKNLTSSSARDAGNIKICLACRPEQEFLDAFLESPGFAIQDYTRNDIQTFAAEPIRTHPRIGELRRHGVSDVDVESLIAEITNKAEGSFLWTRYVTNDIKRHLTSGGDIVSSRQRIELTPPGMDEYFDSILERVDVTLRLKAYIMLEVILRSRAPLTMLQLCLIVQCEEQHILCAASASLPKPTISWNLDASGLARRIVTACRSFLEIDHGGKGCLAEFKTSFPLNSTVSLLHRTARTYLLQGRHCEILLSPGHYAGHRPEDNGHNIILRFCQAYARSLGNNQQCEWQLAVEICHHADLAEATESPASNELLDDCDEILSSTSPDYSCWPLEWCRYKGYEKPNNSMKSWHVDFPAYAVFRNMKQYLTHVLAKVPDMVTNKEGRSLLHFAAFMRGQKENPEMAAILLAHGASVHNRFEGGKNVIESMIPGFRDAETSLALVKILLKYGADPNNHVPLSEESMRLSRDQWFPMLHSTAFMDVSVNREVQRTWVQLFLDSQADPTDSGKRNHADPNSIDSRGRTFPEVLYWYGVTLPPRTWKVILTLGGMITLPMLTAWHRDMRSLHDKKWCVPYTFPSTRSRPPAPKYGPMSPPKEACPMINRPYDPDVDGLPGIYDPFTERDRLNAPDAYHILRQPAFRKQAFYTREAYIFAKQFNNDWK